MALPDQWHFAIVISLFYRVSWDVNVTFRYMKEYLIVIRFIVMFVPAVVIGFLPLTLPYVFLSELLPQFENSDGTNGAAMVLSIGIVGAAYQISDHFKRLVKFFASAASWLLTGDKGNY